MNPETYDWLLSNAKAAFAAFIGAGLTALLQWASSTDFGQWNVVAVPVLGVVVNAVRKWLTK